MLSRVSRKAGRRVVLVLGVAVAVVVGALPALGATAPGFWTMSEADQGHSNRTTNETKLSSSAVPNLVPDYSLAATPEYGSCGGTMNGADGSHLAPVSNGTLLFYFDGRRVVAADLTTGTRRWAFLVTDKDALQRAWSLTLSGSTLIVNELIACDSVSDPDSRLVALDAKTGAQLWTQFVDPAVGEVVVSGTTLVYDAEDAAGSVVEARKVGDGSLLWSDPDCSGPGGVGGATGPFVVGSTVAAECGATQLRATALNLATGARKWAQSGVTWFRGDGPSFPSPQMYRNTSGTTGHLQAVTPAGAIVWTSPTETGPVLAAGPARIFVNCDGGALCALNRTTGTRVWKDATDHPTKAILADDVVYPMPAASPRNADTGAPIGDNIGTDPYLSTAAAAQVSNGHLIVEPNQRLIDVYTLG